MMHALLAASLLASALVAQDPAVDAAKAKAVQAAANAWVAQPTRQKEVGVDVTDVAETFEFVNPHDRAIEFQRLEASCSCSNATILVGSTRYELIPKPWTMVRIDTTPEGETRTPVTAIVVGPRERGSFEVHVKLEGAAKQKVVSLNVHTNDPQTPMMHLSLAVTGQRDFVIEPEELDLGVLEPKSKREFAVAVRTPTKKTFDVKMLNELPKGIEARWEKTEVDGAQLWTLHGTLTAGEQPTPAGASRDGAVIKASLTLPDEPQFSVRLGWKVVRAVEATPGFLSMGQIKLGTKSTHTIRLVRGDGQKLAVTSVVVEGSAAAKEFVAASIGEDGKDAVVTLVVAETAPRGLLRGEVVIQLDHPSCKEQRIGFNGFVR